MIGDIIAELQSLGLRVPEGISRRNGGAGPAEAVYLSMEGRTVSVPSKSAYVGESPYHVRSESDQPVLYKYDEAILPVAFIEKPRFYALSTAEGVPYSQIALLHGADCLATSVYQKCVYWDTAQRCRFCGIQLSLDTRQTTVEKTPEQLAEVAGKAQELDGIGHVVLTTGTRSPPGSETAALAACTAAIKRDSNLAVHAQLMPPMDMTKLSDLKASGVDTVGIHVESFDPGVLSTVAPAKAAMGMERFKEAWKSAVTLFGPNQVSSFVIAGLGEDPDALVNGCEILADMGVYPFVVPLRPIRGSLMEKALPPDPDLMKAIYREVASVLSRKGLSSGDCRAGCVRCGACSALPAFETGIDGVVCHAERTEHERGRALEIRKEIFVGEQGLFETSDEDAHDVKSIHLVASVRGEIIGAVRVYPLEDFDDGPWIGGRLSVREGYRTSGAGERLVNEAVRYVRRQGCSRFTAHIQEKNVPFFRKLGWEPIGPVESYHGRPHRPMAAPLGRKKEDMKRQTIPPQSRPPEADPPQGTCPPQAE